MCLSGGWGTGPDTGVKRAGASLPRAPRAEWLAPRPLAFQCLLAPKAASWGARRGRVSVPTSSPSLTSAHSYLDIIEQAISEGDILLIENIGETVDPVLDPLLGRNTIKKGK